MALNLHSQPAFSDARNLHAGVFNSFNSLRDLHSNKFGCKAPTTSLYFGHGGKTVVCCYNRKHIVGTYPTNTISEIWNSEEIKELRNYILHYDYSLGCQGCLQSILSGNFAGTKANKYDYFKPNTEYPQVMEFELSNTCNLECLMCNGDFSSLIRKNREKKPAIIDAYDENFISQLEEFIPYLREVKFYGGEPFLIDIYYKIWERIININPGINIQIQTNGTVMHRRFKLLMEKGKFNINLSLDSLDKENSKKIRINARLEDIIENSIFFNDYCKKRGTQFRISSCIMQQNYWEIADLIRYANKLNTEISFHVVTYPDHVSLQTLPLQELIAVRNKLQQEVEMLPQLHKIEEQNKIQLVNYINQLEGWITEMNQETETVNVVDMATLLNFITQQTDKRSDISIDRKNQIKIDVIAKLYEVHNSLPANLNLAIAVMALMNKRDTHLKSFSEHIVLMDIKEINKNIINYYSSLKVDDI